MRREFFCPRCKTRLDPGATIILSAKKRDKRGLILLTSEPGDYRAVVSENLELERGDQVEFLCPVCQVSLTSHVDDKLVEIEYRGEDGLMVSVHFSRTYGEHATFFVSGGNVEAYGENADLFGSCNFFGAGGQQD